MDACNIDDVALLMMHALVQNGKIPPNKREVATVAFEYAYAFFECRDEWKEKYPRKPKQPKATTTEKRCVICDTLVSDPKLYESCPRCRCSFSFIKPA